MTLNFPLVPEDCGLVAIDMQNGFCHPEGSRGRAYGPHSVDLARAIIPSVVRLIRCSRTAGVPIWFTRQVHYPDDLIRQKRSLPTHLQRRGVRMELCWRGTPDTNLIDEVAGEVHPEDEVFIKHRASAFFNTPFESELRMRGVKILLIAGVTSSFCVESTIRDAYARDFDIIVPEDAIADSDPEAHQAVLKNIRRYFGLVSTVQEIEAALPAAAEVLS